MEVLQSKCIDERLIDEWLKNGQTTIILTHIKRMLPKINALKMNGGSHSPLHHARLMPRRSTDRVTHHSLAGRERWRAKIIKQSQAKIKMARKIMFCSESEASRSSVLMSSIFHAGSSQGQSGAHLCV